MSREENENLRNYPIKTLLLRPPTVHVRLNASICKFFRPLVILTFIHMYIDLSAAKNVRHDERRRILRKNEKFFCYMVMIV